MECVPGCHGFKFFVLRQTYIGRIYVNYQRKNCRCIAFISRASESQHPVRYTDKEEASRNQVSVD